MFVKFDNSEIHCNNIKAQNTRLILLNAKYVMQCGIKKEKINNVIVIFLNNNNQCNRDLYKYDKIKF